MVYNFICRHIRPLGIAFLFLLISSSCSKDEAGSPIIPVESLGDKGNITVKFTPSFGTEVFEAAKGYAYQGKQRVKFSKVSFYITGIQLLGTNIAKSEQAALIDVTSSGENSKNMALTNLPSGHYTGISFTLGVASELNKKSPKDFPPSNPLSLSSSYWEDWGSYIFTQVQGLLDPEGSGNFTNGFAIQTGLDDCNQTVTIEKEITISESTPATLTLDVDVLQYFKQGNTYYDLITDPLSHNIGDLAALSAFSAVMAKAITLKK